jgi:hypothetical protein
MAARLADVKAFDKASRAGEYYESFMVGASVRARLLRLARERGVLCT